MNLSKYILHELSKRKLRYDGRRLLCPQRINYWLDQLTSRCILYFYPSLTSPKSNNSAQDPSTAKSSTSFIPEKSQLARSTGKQKTITNSSITSKYSSQLLKKLESKGMCKFKSSAKPSIKIILNSSNGLRDTTTWIVETGAEITMRGKEGEIVQ